MDTQVKRYDWQNVQIEELDAVKVAEYRARWAYYFSDPNRLAAAMKIRALKVSTGLRLGPIADKAHIESVRNFAYGAAARGGIKAKCFKIANDDGTWSIIVHRVA